jgi:hypothetical protein
VVADKQVHLYTALRKVSQSTQRTNEALGHNTAILEPEVENIAHKIYGCGILGYVVEPTTEGALGTSSLQAVTCAEMDIRCKVDHRL